LQVQKAQDLFYIRNWSIWLDIYILLQTVIVVLNGRGAKWIRFPGPQSPERRHRVQSASSWSTQRSRDLRIFSTRDDAVSYRNLTASNRVTSLAGFRRDPGPPPGRGRRAPVSPLRLASKPRRGFSTLL